MLKRNTNAIKTLVPVHKGNQGQRGQCPQDAQKYILTKKCAKNSLFFCLEPCSGGFTAAIQGSRVPPRRVLPPRQISGYVYDAYEFNVRLTLHYTV